MVARFVRSNEIEARSFYVVLAERIAMLSSYAAGAAGTAYLVSHDRFLKRRRTKPTLNVLFLFVL